MWLINWIGLVASNIMMTYLMFSIGEILTYILSGMFVINTFVVLWMWYNWPKELIEVTTNKFDRKTPTVMKHTYGKYSHYR